MYLEECDDRLEEQYFEWLDETCKCNIKEDGCSCQKFEDWWEGIDLYRQECNCDF